MNDVKVSKDKYILEERLIERIISILDETVSKLVHAEEDGDW